MAKGFIQRFPSALLPLLNIKSEETPRQLEEVVQGGLEMLPFYAADRLEVRQITQAGASAVNTIISIPVPAGEFWLVHSVMALALNVTAGAVVKLSVGVSNPSGAVAQLGAHQSPIVAAAGELFALPALPGTPLLLPSGWNLVASMLQATGGATTLDLYCRALVARFTPT